MGTIVYTGTATFIKSLFRYLFRWLLLLFKSDCSVNFVAFCWDQTIIKMFVIPLFLNLFRYSFEKHIFFMQKSTLILEFTWYSLNLWYIYCNWIDYPLFFTAFPLHFLIRFHFKVHPFFNWVKVTKSLLSSFLINYFNLMFPKSYNRLFGHLKLVFLLSNH